MSYIEQDQELELTERVEITLPNYSDENQIDKMKDMAVKFGTIVVGDEGEEY